MGNPVYTIIWLLILIFIAFWVAFFCAGFYVLFYCIEACLPAVSDISGLLLKGVQLPNYCAKKMLEGAPLG